MSRTKRTLTGLGLVIGGALLGLIALTVLPWYRDTLGGFFVFGTKTSDLRQTISFYKSARDIYDVLSYGVSPVYFGWLAITLLIVAALAAAATVGFNPRTSRVIGLAAALVALAGFVLTALAIQLVDVDAARLERATGLPSKPPGYLDYLGATSVGAWAMAVAYLAIGVGALLATGGRDAVRTLLADPPDDDSPPSADEPVPEDPTPEDPTPDDPTPVIDDVAEPPTRRENW